MPFVNSEEFIRSDESYMTKMCFAVMNIRLSRLNYIEVFCLLITR